jgi:hypothetical protein
MTLYFTETLNENGRIGNYRNVKAYIGDKNELIIYCCDINNTAQKMWGDSGVEFYLIVSEQNKYKLAKKLGLTQNEGLIQNIKNVFAPKNVEPPDEKLLEKIYAEFGEKDSCFEDIMRYFESNNIEFNYQRW